MKEIVPLLIVGASFVLFLVLHTIKRSKEGKPTFLKKVWRGIVAVFDFITNFG